MINEATLTERAAIVRAIKAEADDYLRAGEDAERDDVAAKYLFAAKALRQVATVIVARERWDE
jgi:hypothetical protein